MATQLWSILLVISSTILSSAGSFYMKVASSRVSFKIDALIKNLPLAYAFGLHTISAVIGVIAFKGGELTVLVPLASLNYIWTSLLAVYFLNENMNKWKWTGVGMIIFGVILVGLGDLA